jgi:hypothetical protein
MTHLFVVGGGWRLVRALSSDAVYSWSKFKKSIGPLVMYAISAVELALPWRRVRDHFAVIMMSFTLAALSSLFHPHMWRPAASCAAPRGTPKLSRRPGAEDDFAKQLLLKFHLQLRRRVRYRCRGWAWGCGGWRSDERIIIIIIMMIILCRQKIIVRCWRTGGCDGLPGASVCQGAPWWCGAPLTLPIKGYKFNRY